MNDRDLTHLQPPNNLEAECGVLGALLRDTASYGLVQPILSVNSFYHRPHQLIYSTIQRLHEQNQPVDIVTVVNSLSSSGQLDNAGGRAYLVEIMESVVSSAFIVKHAELVRETYLARELIGIGNEVVRSCYLREEPIHDVIGRVSSQTASLLSHNNHKGFRRLSEIAVEVVSGMDDYTTGKKRGKTSGFPSIDELTGGFQQGDLVVVAGRPGTGKTGFSYNTAANQASVGVRVGYFSAETKAEDFAMRALCTGGKVNSMRWKTGKLEENEYNRVTLEHNRLGSWPFWVCDTPRIEIHSLIAQASYLKAKEDIDVLYIDYGQLITTRERYRDRREQINYIIQKLKELARILSIPVVAISQLSRESVKHKNRPPMLSDLKETGAWEEDADLILALWKPTTGRKQDMTEANDQLVECLLLKQRNGPTGKVEFAFEREYTRFSDLNAGQEQGDMPF